MPNAHRSSKDVNNAMQNVDNNDGAYVLRFENMQKSFIKLRI